MFQGRTFRGLIQSFVENHGPLNNVYLPLYKTPEGKKAYEATLASLNKNFPQYIKELEGTAEGAKVPFCKVRLFHDKKNDYFTQNIGQKQKFKL